MQATGAGSRRRLYSVQPRIVEQLMTCYDLYSLGQTLIYGGLSLQTDRPIPDTPVPPSLIPTRSFCNDKRKKETRRSPPGLCSPYGFPWLVCVRRLSGFSGASAGLKHALFNLWSVDFSLFCFFSFFLRLCSWFSCVFCRPARILPLI